MKIRLSRRAYAFVLAGGLIVLAAGTAKAIFSTDFTYTAAQTGYLQIPAPLFSATKSTAQWEQDGLEIWPTVNSNTCFLAPVNLPADARMTRLTVWYRRAVATIYNVQMFRYRTSDGATDIVANGSPAVAANRTAFNVTTATGNVRIVDNQHFGYIVLVCMNSSANTFGGARITYTYTSAGD